jgi:hypothetical protein
LNGRISLLAACYNSSDDNHFCKKQTAAPVIKTMRKEKADYVTTTPEGKALIK